MLLLLLRLCLCVILSASVSPESVRETETWMPMKTTQAVAMEAPADHPESSGDFDFIDESYNSEYDDEDDDEDDDDDDYYDTDDYEEWSGSGDGDEETTVSPQGTSESPVKHDIVDNKIPEAKPPVRPSNNEQDVVQDNNDILLRKEPEPSEEYPSNVLMAHAGDDSILNKTEVLAALIAGCAICLVFATLLILLLVYRMKKKDEGSYDLGKKPIYKKAPTTEIYA